MKVVLLGVGNIAHYFASQLNQNSDFQLVQVYGRDAEKTKTFGAQFGIPTVFKLEAVLQEADIFLYAVNDGSIESLAKIINRKTALHIHCAGSQSLSLLENAGENQAIIWPIYSINKEQEFTRTIPLIIDGSSNFAIQTATLLSKEISDMVSTANFEQRKYLHLNAVLVNNFTNHLLTIAEKICEEQQISFELLLPIIKQTTERVQITSPFQSQTGPAKRNDEQTMLAQYNLLNIHPEWQAIYQALSDSIVEMYKK